MSIYLSIIDTMNLRDAWIISSTSTRKLKASWICRAQKEMDGRGMDGW